MLIIENATVNGNAGAVDAYAGGAYTAGTNNELHLIGNAVVGAEQAQISTVGKRINVADTMAWFMSAERPLSAVSPALTD